MSVPVPSPLYLTILRKGDTHLIDLAEVGSLIPRSETQVEDSFLRELTDEFARLVTPGYGERNSGNVPQFPAARESTSGAQDLQRIGGLIFSHLLTDAARQRLRSANSCDLYLRLDEQLIQAPWELCYDGADFLATKFRVGRQVITSAPIPRTAKQAPKDSLRVLIIADPTESLPEAGREAELLCTLLDQEAPVDITLLGGKQVRKIPLLTALQTHDVVHFAGHSHYDPDNPSKSGWQLHEGVLTAGELSKLSRPPQLVFSNSCQAGVTTAWRGGARYEGQAFGIGSAFLLAGVQNYIGTFWVTYDDESVLFATTFYRSLVGGHSLGAALLSARHEMLKQRGWNGLTWASYMLYGDPTFTALPEVKNPQHSASLASERRFSEHPSIVKPGIESETTPIENPKEERGSPRVAHVFSQLQWLRNHRILRGATIFGGLLLLLGGIKFALPLFSSKLTVPQTTRKTESSLPLPSPDKSSIVVLPFVNMSEDPEDEYFSDGITEDLVTDLSKLSSLFVIARNSSFFYKGKTVNLEQVSRELGVRYVLQGSVRKVNKLVRITAQLIDATTGRHLWAERYDRPLRDIFALQDEISHRVVAALKVKLTPREQQHFDRTPTTNLEAYDYLLRGWAYYRRSTPKSNEQARRMFAKAIELDPAYADAHAALSATYLLEWVWQWNQNFQILEQAFDSAQKASALEHSLPLAHVVLSNVSLWKRQYENAVSEAEKAIALDPNYAEGYATLGEIMTWVGKPQEAVRWVENAIRLNPHAASEYFWILGHAYRLMGLYETAIAMQQRVLSHNPDHIGAHAELAALYSKMGKEKKAQAEVAEILRTSPHISLGSLRQSLPYKNQLVLERFLSDLRNATLPQ